MDNTQFKDNINTKQVDVYRNNTKLGEVVTMEAFLFQDRWNETEDERWGPSDAAD